MLVEKGKVASVTPGRAVVSITKSDACQGCSARGACLTFGTAERRIEVDDPVGVEVGAEVEIGLPPERVVWASTIAYLVPVAAMVAGGVACSLWWPGTDRDVGSAVGAFSGLALAALGIWIHGRILDKRSGVHPVIVRVSVPSADGLGVDTDCALG